MVKQTSTRRSKTKIGEIRSPSLRKATSTGVTSAVYKSATSMVVSHLGMKQLYRGSITQPISCISLDVGVPPVSFCCAVRLAVDCILRTLVGLRLIERIGEVLRSFGGDTLNVVNFDDEFGPRLVVRSWLSAIYEAGRLVESEMGP